MQYDVCVIGGCGHVGLPLAIALANRQQRVVILDVDQNAAAQVRSGRMPFVEMAGEEELLVALNSGNLRVADSPEVISKSEILVLVVGTPIDKHLAPSFRAVETVLEQYWTYFRSGQVLILRSTLYPGTSERVHRWLLERHLEVHVAVCPERIAQGYALRELAGLPQIVAAFSPEGLQAACGLFGTLTDDLIIMEPLEAELAKLFTNAWRYIKFAAANQFFMIARDFGADFDRIYHAVTHNYPRAADLPRPGFTAGPCLFKDTMQLSAFTNNNFFLGHAAMLINEGMPHFVVSRLRRQYDLSKMTVGILGIAFKADVDDDRDSLSYKLKNLLEIEARRLLWSDPFVQLPGVVSTETLLNESDLVVIATPHSCYRSLKIVDKPVVDIWNVLGKGTNL